MTGCGTPGMPVMVSSKLFLLVAPLAVCLSGCSGEDNSPSMGDVPPKPNPNVVNQMPPAVREQMNRASSGQKEQAEQMRKAAEAAKQQTH